MVSPSPAAPVPGGRAGSYHTSLLTAQDCRNHVHLILGNNTLAAARIRSSLSAGVHPILIAPCSRSSTTQGMSHSSPLETLLSHPEIAPHLATGAVTHLPRSFRSEDLFELGRPEVDAVVDAVFVTSCLTAATATALASQESHGKKQQGRCTATTATTTTAVVVVAAAAAATATTSPSAAKDPEVARLSALCRRHRIPINVLDAPALCSFSLLSVHADGPLQVGVTTNGRGCRLAGRIRREVAAALPPGLGEACERLGEVRRRVAEEDRTRTGQQQQQQQQQKKKDVGLFVETGAQGNPQQKQDEQEQNHVDHGRQHDADKEEEEEGEEEGTDDSTDQTAAFNQLVTEADEHASRTRRMRWLAQVCEYWPLKRLAAITDADVDTILKSYPGMDEGSTIPGSTLPGKESTIATTMLSTTLPTKMGRIILAGSGPGHPDLLTRATYRAIQSADLVLADKLVPAGVLDLIPRRTPVVIARKFPGNADRAQDELLDRALEGVRAGHTVLRLKQGDPFLYGRGGEEVAFFRDRGVFLNGSSNSGGSSSSSRSNSSDRIVVLPGVTSALSAPLFAGVPATQRDIADQVLICTGTGRKGRPPAPPEFVASRTAVFLMALHRISGLVAELTRYTTEEEGGEEEEEEDEEGPGNSGRKRRTLWPLHTPCAVVERASCPDQRVIRTTLRHVAEAVEQEGSRPPGLLVAGGACEALYTPDPGRAWTVEDGFRSMDIINDFVPAGLAALA